MKNRVVSIFAVIFCLIVSVGCSDSGNASKNISNNVTLGDYKNIAVTVEKSDVTEANIQSYIERMIGTYVTDSANKPSYSELTDSFVATNMNDTECKTVAELKQKVSDYLNGMNEYYAENNTRSAITQKLGEICSVKKIPDDILDERVTIEEKVFKANCNKRYGMEFEEYLKSYGITEETLHSQTVADAKSKIESELILAAIAEREKITVGDGEIKEYAEQMLENYGYESIDALYEDYGEGYVKNACLCDKVLKELAKNTKVTFVAPGSISAD